MSRAQGFKKEVERYQMKRKNVLKLIVGICLVAVLSIALPLAGGCAPQPAAPTEPTQPTEPTAPTEPTEPTVPEPAEEQPTFHWRATTPHAPAQAADIVRPGLDEIEQMSGGRLTFELYSSGELMPEDQIIGALKAGTIDLVQTNAPCCSAPIDLFELDGHAGWIWGSPQESMALYYERGLMEYFKESYEELGDIVYLGVLSNSDPIHLISTKPVDSLEDLEGLKINADRSVAYPFVQAGAETVVIPVEEYYLSAQTGVVDGLTWCGATESYSNGWYEVYTNLMDPPVNGGASIHWMANVNSWSSIPSDLQEIIIHGLRSMQVHYLHYYYDGEPTYRPYHNLTRMPADDWEQLTEWCMELWDNEVAAKSPRAAAVINLLRDYREEMENAKWWR
jgi:TRAP-type C4-dicarboxylate transport system substrate-binding protein